MRVNRLIAMTASDILTALSTHPQNSVCCLLPH